MTLHFSIKSKTMKNKKKFFLNLRIKTLIFLIKKKAVPLKLQKRNKKAINKEFCFDIFVYKENMIQDLMTK